MTIGIDEPYPNPEDNSPSVLEFYQADIKKGCDTNNYKLLARVITDMLSVCDMDDVALIFQRVVGVDTGEFLHDILVHAQPYMVNADKPGSEYETYTVMVVSTAHITQQDNERLPLHLDPEPGRIASLVGDDTRYGYLVYCGAEDFDAAMDDARDAGFSDALINLLTIAHKRGCRYLNLDRDGEVYDDLPTFEW